MTAESLPPVAAQYEWRHPDPLTRAFELVDGATIAGSLRFTNLVGSRAHGTAFGVTWAFRRIGIFRPRIELRAADASDEAEPMGTITLDFGGSGLLERAGEAPLHWTVAPSGNGDAWGWKAGDDVLMTFEHRPAEERIIASLIQAHGHATLTPAAAARSDVPLLLLAGWYLMAARQFDLVTNPPGL